MLSQHRCVWHFLVPGSREKTRNFTFVLFCSKVFIYTYNSLLKFYNCLFHNRIAITLTLCRYFVASIVRHLQVHLNAREINRTINKTRVLKITRIEVRIHLHRRKTEKTSEWMNFPSTTETLLRVRGVIAFRLDTAWLSTDRKWKRILWRRQHVRRVSQLISPVAKELLRARLRSVKRDTFVSRLAGFSTTIPALVFIAAVKSPPRRERKRAAERRRRLVNFRSKRRIATASLVNNWPWQWCRESTVDRSNWNLFEFWGKRRPIDKLTWCNLFAIEWLSPLRNTRNRARDFLSFSWGSWKSPRRCGGAG